MTTGKRSGAVRASTTLPENYIVAMVFFGIKSSGY